MCSVISLTSFNYFRWVLLRCIQVSLLHVLNTQIFSCCVRLEYSGCKNLISHLVLKGTPDRVMKGTDNKICLEDFVLVKFTTRKTISHAVGCVIKVLDGTEFSIKFLKKSQKTNNFLYPEQDDISDVTLDDIVMKLPPPHQNMGTKSHFLVLTQTLLIFLVYYKENICILNPVPFKTTHVLFNTQWFWKGQNSCFFLMQLLIFSIKFFIKFS